MTRRAWAVALVLLFGLYGCGDDTKEDKEGLNESETKEVLALKSTWHDWESVELRNGLVSVQVVPRLGGRTLGYEFNGRSLVYANPKLYGHTPGAEESQRQPWVPGTGGAEQTPSEPAATDQPSEELNRAEDQGPNLTEPAPERAEPTVDVPGGGLRSRTGRLHPVETAGEPAKPAESAPVAGEPAPAEGTGHAEGTTGIGESEAKPAMPESGEVAAEPVAHAAEAEPLRYIPSQTSEKYRNYGGQTVWPGPRSHWTQPWPPPEALDLGGYEPKITRTDGDTAEVELASPPDETLGVKLAKTITLFRGSTVIRVVSRLTNTGARTRAWCLEDVSQHPGALTPGETFTKDVQMFLPLSPASRHHLGYVAMLGNQTSDQYFPEKELFRLEYLGQEGMVGSDDLRGWVAYADRRNETLLVKLATLDPRGTYAEGGVTSTLYTAPGEAESYVQMGLRSPLREVEPNGDMTLTVTYGATTCPLPIVSASLAGVVNTPLKAVKLGDTVKLNGVFGTFYTGHAQIVFYNEAGQELARTAPVALSPTQPYRLDSVANLPDGTVRAALMITNSRRVDIAVLADSGIEEIQPEPGAAVVAEPTTPSGEAEATPAAEPVAEPAIGPEPAAAGTTMPTAPEAAPTTGGNEVGEPVAKPKLPGTAGSGQ